MAETRRARTERGETFVDSADIERAVAEGLPDVKEVEALHEQAEADKSDDEHCENHPGRKGRVFTPNNAVRLVLCDYCTPSWFKTE